MVARAQQLQQQFARQKKGSARRAATRAQIAGLNVRIRNRRTDFPAWTANRLTRGHGMVVVEDLKIRNMTAGAKGTVAAPGVNVAAKAELNRAILAKGWGALLTILEHKARYNGSRIVRVPPAYTSQRCSACGTVDAKSRESQAVFACTSCAYTGNADVNAAKNILAAGPAVTGRGDLAVGRSAKRQPPVTVAVQPQISHGNPRLQPWGGSQDSSDLARLWLEVEALGELWNVQATVQTVLHGCPMTERQGPHPANAGKRRDRQGSLPGGGVYGVNAAVLAAAEAGRPCDDPAGVYAVNTRR
ncbi:transposase, partial [Planomonospora venezuelensis]|nr:IS605 OrfB family transposase [Planomonospora venezuelensis]